MLEEKRQRRIQKDEMNKVFHELKEREERKIRNEVAVQMKVDRKRER